MKVGSKYRFWIPSDLGYGDRGAPPQIGPGELLIFEVELLEVKSAEVQGK
jgi:FKBP-type peptidyl-prolyl cis-trans isomerase